MTICFKGETFDTGSGELYISINQAKGEKAITVSAYMNRIRVFHGIYHSMSAAKRAYRRQLKRLQELL